MSAPPLLIRAYYMDQVHGDLEEIAADLADATRSVRFDTLVGTGLSGALVVPAVARALDKHWLIVRKPKENAHTGRLGEGTLGSRWLFVDDLISSGATYHRVKRIIATICAEHNHKASHAGYYLYNDDEFRRAKR